MHAWNRPDTIMRPTLLPLALLPGWAQVAANILPFSILYAFPIQILLGQADSAAILQGLVRQLAWILVLAFISGITWRRGLLAYEAYGG